MAISINSIEKLQQYLIGVLGRSNHHAGDVNEVSLSLLGAIIWVSRGEIEVREYKGRPANMIWFHGKNGKYVLMYNHETGEIELKNRSYKSEKMFSFTNLTTNAEIIQIFKEL
jgi:hypothetical protein